MFLNKVDFFRLESLKMIDKVLFERVMLRLNESFTKFPDGHIIDNYDGTTVTDPRNKNANETINRIVYSLKPDGKGGLFDSRRFADFRVFASIQRSNKVESAYIAIPDWWLIEKCGLPHNANGVFVPKDSMKQIQNSFVKTTENGTQILSDVTKDPEFGTKNGFINILTPYGQSILKARYPNVNPKLFIPPI